MHPVLDREVSGAWVREEDWRNLFPGEAGNYVATTSAFIVDLLYQFSTICGSANILLITSFKISASFKTASRTRLRLQTKNMALSSRALCTRLLKKVFVILQNYCDAAQI